MGLIKLLNSPIQSNNPRRQVVYTILWFLFLGFLGSFMIWTIMTLFSTLSLHPSDVPTLKTGSAGVKSDKDTDMERLQFGRSSDLSKPWKKFTPSQHVDPTKKYAYASLLCDDAMVGPAQVLVYSMKQTNTPFPFLILLLPSVSESVELSLKKLGAVLLRINMLDYPFPVNAEKIAINKMCRYSKLHIWSQTDYEKIVFVDMDMLIVRNLDDVFEYPEFSAVKDAGDAYNTGLFVLKPSMFTYKDMLNKYVKSPSYNQGDQGFINWYFGGGRDSGQDLKYSLPVEYNVMVKNQRFGEWPEIMEKARIYHLTSETKPWTFYYMHHKLWKDNFEPSVFYLWNREFNKVAQKLSIDVFAGAVENLDIPKAEAEGSLMDETGNGHNIEGGSYGSNAPFDDASVYRHKRYHYSNWPNLPRQAYFCEQIYKDYSPSERYFIESKFSVLIYKFSSLSTLGLLLDSFQGAPFIEKVFVNWPYMPDETLFEFPETLKKYKTGVPKTQFIRQRYPSFNNKFSPINDLRTKALFLVTDKFETPKWYDMELGFSVWKNSRKSLVGFRPYSNLKLPQLFVSPTGPAKPKEASLHQDDASSTANPDGTTTSNSTGSTSNGKADNDVLQPPFYSIMSTNGLFMSSEYLFIYTCLLPQKLHKFIDECKVDTSDLALNMLVMGMHSAPPIAIVPPKFNPRRWVPESPYEMPRKDKEGRVIGPLHKRKRRVPRFLPMNFLASPSNSTDGSLHARSTEPPLSDEEFMSRLFFNMNAYVETAFKDILTQNKDVESHFYEDTSALDATSLDNSSPLDVADDQMTLKMKESALKDLAVHFFHFTDPTLAWNRANLDPKNKARKISLPKGLFIKNKWVASRFEKIPFTKMSLKKWRYMVKTGLIESKGNFLLKGKSKPRKNATPLPSVAPAFSDLSSSVNDPSTSANPPSALSHISLLSHIDGNSVEGLSIVLNQIEASAKTVDDREIAAAESPQDNLLSQSGMDPVPYNLKIFKDGEPPFDSKVIKSKRHPPP